MNSTVGVINFTACMFLGLKSYSRLKSNIILPVSVYCFST